MAGLTDGTPPLARMRSITKRFGRVTVLEGVDVDIHAGEVLVLAGENGAGKSTLIKILGGVHADFEGAIEIEGAPARPAAPLDARRLGISVIFQELSLVPAMTVADNIFLENPVCRFGFVNDAAQRASAQKLLDQLGIPVDVTRCVEDLPISQQQLVEIAKALSHEARVIVMDEPTSALNAPEVEKLFGLIASLKRRGCGIVYITHKMEEIERIADRITVLRDGRHVGTAPAASLPRERVIGWMVGREPEEQYSSPRRESPGTAAGAEELAAALLPTGAPANRPGVSREGLRLDRFSVLGSGRQGRLVSDVSFSVSPGEIVGVAGLQGSGNSDLFLGLFGAYGHRTAGRACLNGVPLSISTPARSIEQGVAMLTNDRKATGLVLTLSIVANATLAALPRLCRSGWRRPRRERAVTEQQARRLSIRAASFEQPVSTLSGGNQQKVALAKWLQTEPRLLLLDEPTRGIDVGAKREIYELLSSLAAQGMAILLITSELPELLALSDRIVVMHRGAMTAVFTRADATPDRIIAAAMGNYE